jgi:hypothetical protein
MEELKEINEIKIGDYINATKTSMKNGWMTAIFKAKSIDTDYFHRETIHSDNFLLFKGKKFLKLVKNFHGGLLKEHVVKIKRMTEEEFYNAVGKYIIIGSLLNEEDRTGRH